LARAICKAREAARTNNAKRLREARPGVSLYLETKSLIAESV
jgi:hypothetical protein